MDLPTENVFDIEDSHLYGCTIRIYNSGHSTLIIHAKKHGKPAHENNFFLTFGGVAYLDCPTGWGGANFILGSDEECRSIFQSLGDYYMNYQDHLPTLYKLKPNNAERTLKIIARGVAKSKEFPSWLK